MGELILFMVVVGVVLAVLTVVRLITNAVANYKSKFLNKIIDGNKRKNGHSKKAKSHRTRE